MSDEQQATAARAMESLVEVLRGKSVGPDEQRVLDAEAQAATNARFKAQLESQAKTQQLHLRSVEASEREAAAWERIANALERIVPSTTAKETT